MKEEYAQKVAFLHGLQPWGFAMPFCKEVTSSQLTKDDEGCGVHGR